ncbi:hypothetical protein V1478_017464 [Vespula squamosa]|uniref:Uncharacterized protein n=1 Tax=Vespula squamosa TaxID=30214 RepID=A0ABD1ZWZ0_VESSQ
MENHAKTLLYSRSTVKLKGSNVTCESFVWSTPFLEHKRFSEIPAAIGRSTFSKHELYPDASINSDIVHVDYESAIPVVYRDGSHRNGSPPPPYFLLDPRSASVQREKGEACHIGG